MSTLYDKIASIGMFEHVGRARLPEYFAKIRRLLADPGIVRDAVAAGKGARVLCGAGVKTGDDVRAALAFVRENAADLRIDRELGDLALGAALLAGFGLLEGDLADRKSEHGFGDP